jgi:hypothetical protein
VLPTQLLRNVKPSHKIDLAYLYYLPFCSVFTSKDNFHAEIVPLFLTSEQRFVNGIALKEDLAKLVAHYESLPEDVLKTGLIHFAAYPPDDAAFLVTRLWDQYLPGWRTPRKKSGSLMKSIDKPIPRSFSRTTNTTSTRWITRKRPSVAVLTTSGVC